MIDPMHPEVGMPPREAADVVRKAPLREGREPHMFEPVKKSITVERSPEDSFQLFTERIGDWWPVEHYSRTADEGQGDVKVERMVFEPHEGGRIYEIASNGTEGSWATILAYEPPERVVLAWKPNDEDRPPTEVEIRFTADGTGTRVDLEHRGWEMVGDLAQEARSSYSAGWDLVLGRFATAAAG